MSRTERLCTNFTRMHPSILYANNSFHLFEVYLDRMHLANFRVPIIGPPPLHFTVCLLISPGVLQNIEMRVLPELKIGPTWSKLSCVLLSENKPVLCFPILPDWAAVAAASFFLAVVVCVLQSSVCGPRAEIAQIKILSLGSCHTPRFGDKLLKSEIFSESKGEWERLC